MDRSGERTYGALAGLGVVLLWWTVVLLGIAVAAYAAWALR